MGLERAVVEPSFNPSMIFSEFEVSLLYSEFQDSQGCFMEKPCLEPLPPPRKWMGLENGMLKEIWKLFTLAEFSLHSYKIIDSLILILK